MNHQSKGRPTRPSIRSHAEGYRGSVTVAAELAGIARALSTMPAAYSPDFLIPILSDLSLRLTDHIEDLARPLTYEDDITIAEPFPEIAEEVEIEVPTFHRRRLK